MTSTVAPGPRLDRRPAHTGTGPPARLAVLAEVVLSPLAVALAAARALVRRPSPLVAATLVLVCVPSGRTDVAASTHVAPADIGVVALVAAVAIGVVTGRRSLTWRAWPPFGLLLAALAVTTVTSQDALTSATGFVRYAELFVLIPVAVAAAVRDRIDVVLVAGTVIAVASLEGAIGVWQYLTATGASYGGQGIRAVGTFGAVDVMGMAIVVALGIVVALALALTRRGRARVMLLAVAAALVVPLAFSLSRGTWIAAAVAAVAVAVVAGWRVLVAGAVVVLAVTVILIGGLGVGSGTLGERVQSIAPAAGPTDQSVSDRYGLWRTATGMWADHPITGVGPKNFSAFRDGYAPLSISSGSDVEDASTQFTREPLLSPHNMYLLVLSEQGMIGFGAFALFLGTLAISAIRRRGRYVWPATADTRFLDLAAPGIIAWVAVDFLYSDIGGPPTIYIAVLLGLVVRRGLTDELPSRTSPPPDLATRPAAPPPDLATRAAAPPPAPVAPAAAGPADPGDDRPERRSGLLLRAAAVSAILSVLGTVLGLGRDLMLAGFFGATGGTDAFLVAWTVPETAAPLLIEGAMAFILVPLFSRVLAHGDSLREAVGATLPRIGLALAGLGALTGLVAPSLVRVLAPGLADPGLAVTATRLVSVTVLTFGLAGYLSAALRASHVFAAPAAIYVAYNLGIMAAIITLHGRLGVVSAAVGVAVGSGLMVLCQLPSFLRHVGPPRRLMLRSSAITLGAVAPIALFTLTRQAQVFVERFVGSSLPPGTISHLNYAQKVAQVPMVLALVFTTVTFPALARSMASRDDAGALRRVRTDLRTIAAVVLLAVAYLEAFAPAVVSTLFERGRFLEGDTAATAAILRVYLLGLLGHAFVGALSRPFFSAVTSTWYPAAAMAGGLAVTGVLALALAGPWGASGIAAANAAGITVTAALLLVRVRDRIPDFRARTSLIDTARLAVPAAAGLAVGWCVSRLLGGLPAPAVATVGAVVVALTFVAVAALLAPSDARRAFAGVQRGVAHVAR
jgi:murein biosynthesis integral membrane protein MurJ